MLPKCASKEEDNDNEDLSSLFPFQRLPVPALYLVLTHLKVKDKAAMRVVSRWMYETVTKLDVCMRTWNIKFNSTTASGLESLLKTLKIAKQRQLINPLKLYIRFHLDSRSNVVLSKDIKESIMLDWKDFVTSLESYHDLQFLQYLEEKKISFPQLRRIKILERGIGDCFKHFLFMKKHMDQIEDFTIFDTNSENPEDYMKAMKDNGIFFPKLHTLIVGGHSKIGDLEFILQHESTLEKLEIKTFHLQPLCSLNVKFLLLKNLCVEPAAQHSCINTLIKNKSSQLISLRIRNADISGLDFPNVNYFCTGDPSLTLPRSCPNLQYLSIRVAKTNDQTVEANLPAMPNLKVLDLYRMTPWSSRLLEKTSTSIQVVCVRLRGVTNADEIQFNSTYPKLVKIIANKCDLPLLPWANNLAARCPPGVHVAIDSYNQHSSLLID